jgi:hypothetical protein
VIFKDRPQTLRERADLVRPAQGVVNLPVDLGQDAVEDEVVELLLASDVSRRWACVPRSQEVNEFS